MGNLARLRFALARGYALQICLAVGVLVNLVVFRGSVEILHLAGGTVVLCTILAVIVRSLCAAAAIAANLCSLAAAVVYMFLTSDDRGLYLRNLLSLLLVSSPIMLGVFRVQVARRWREAILLIATSALLIGLLWLAGPHLLSRIVPSYHLDIDHRPKPFDKTLRTNQDGIVSPFAPSDFRLGDFNIIFLGDSFTQGTRVPYPFPALVESSLTVRFPARRFRVANFGWMSSSPVLQARQLLDIGAKYKPKLVVQCFDMTDFHDDLKYSHWFRKRGIDPVQITIFQVGWRAFSRALGVQDYAEWLRSQLRWGDANPNFDRDRPRPRYFGVGQALERSAPLFQTSWDAILATRTIAQNLRAKRPRENN